MAITPKRRKRRKPLSRSIGAEIISIITVLGFVSVCAAMMFVPVKDTAVANVMFGSLGSGFTLVLGYWLGSSKSSRDKDYEIDRLRGYSAENRRGSLSDGDGSDSTDEEEKPPCDK
jgi:hypothetical protein